MLQSLASRSTALFKKTPTLVFLSEYCKIFKNIYFGEHLPTAAFGKYFFLHFNLFLVLSIVIYYENMTKSSMECKDKHCIKTQSRITLKNKINIRRVVDFLLSTESFKSRGLLVKWVTWVRGLHGLRGLKYFFHGL